MPSILSTPNGDFYVEKQLGTTAVHHESFQKLWETKWKAPVRTYTL
jgi:hypothetical protein